MTAPLAMSTDPAPLGTIEAYLEQMAPQLALARFYADMSLDFASVPDIGGMVHCMKYFRIHGRASLRLWDDLAAMMQARREVRDAQPSP